MDNFMQLVTETASAVGLVDLNAKAEELNAGFVHLALVPPRRQVGFLPGSLSVPVRHGLTHFRKLTWLQ